MASWRVGYMVIPESLWDAINKIQDTLLICAPVVSQVAAVAALGVGRAYAASQHRPARAEMRQTIGQRARRSGGPVHRGASPTARSTSSSACSRRIGRSTLTERLIREHRVAVVPGERVRRRRVLDPRVVRRARSVIGRTKARGDSSADFRSLQRT